MTKTTRILALPLAALGLAALSLVTAQGASAASGHQLRVLSSGKCLDVPGWSKSWGTPVDQWSCVNQANENWIIYRAKTVHLEPLYEIKNVNSGLCLNIKDASKRRGAAVIQWPCDKSADNELFYKTIQANDSAIWTNRNSKLCLNVAGNSKANGARLTQWTCNGSFNEIFKY
ncbi:RICIN domain-containing protein [Streptomyces sp. NPDC020719]|uniref:RICIN domain-containing protein n=1 Tax=Streptomyces sp. NPDC020719 TaxID=3154896 RepID=UPI0033E62FA4